MEVSSPSVFATPRLMFREFSTADASGFFALNADPDVLRYTGDVPFESVKAAAQFIRDYTHYQRYGFGRWSVFLRETPDTYIGFCGLNHRTVSGEVDVGFRFMKQYWGMGYATEAALGSIWYGFEHYQLPKIIAQAMLGNAASHRVIQKLGMKNVGDVEQEDGVWGKYEILCADAVKPEWVR